MRVALVTLIWYIRHEFGFDVYRDGIVNIANGSGTYDWNNWAVQLCDSTGSNIATIFGIYNILLPSDHRLVWSVSSGRIVHSLTLELLVALGKRKTENSRLL